MIKKLFKVIRSSFYYYDDRWNFPYGNNVGYIIIQRNLDVPIDDETRKLITIFEKYLNDNNIPSGISLEDFDKIWNKVKKLSD